MRTGKRKVSEQRRARRRVSSQELTSSYKRCMSEEVSEIEIVE